MLRQSKSLKKYKYYIFILLPIILIYFLYKYFQEIENEQKRKIQAEIDLKKRLVDEQIANSGGQNLDGSDRYDKNDPTGAKNVLTKISVGAAAGASVGSAVPVIGTAIGGVVGAALGAGIGVYEENENFRDAMYKLDITASDTWANMDPSNPKNWGF